MKRRLTRRTLLKVAGLAGIGSLLSGISITLAPPRTVVADDVVTSHEGSQPTTVEGWMLNTRDL